MSETELTPEEIEKYRRLVKTADQRKKGSNITYERRMPDGSHITVQMNGATPEQVALIQWLQAEEAWKAQKAWRAREIKVELERQRKIQEELTRQDVQIAKHEARLDSPVYTGFRRDALLRHSPVRPPRQYYQENLKCRSCYTTDYEPENVDFPCPEYVFTTEWEATPEKDDND